MPHSFTASDQVTLQVSNPLETWIASWTAEGFDECMDIVNVTEMTIISHQLNILLVLFDASSPTIAPSIRSMSYMKILIPTVSSTDGISSMQTPWNFEGSGFLLLIEKRLHNFDVFSSSLFFSMQVESKCSEEAKIVFVWFFGVLFVSKAID